MSTTRPQRALTLSMLLLILMALVSLHEPAAAAASTPPPDADLYTSYFFGTGYQNVTWVVCGSTQQTEGCYDSGDLGPFGQVGAMIESNPAIDLTTNTVTRLVYVVDIASGSGGNGVELYVYKKTDVVSSTFDTTTVTLLKSVTLPLIGGSTTSCSMAANGGYLFIGTNLSPQAVRVQKSNFSLTQVGGFSPPSYVTSITSDKYGFVTVTFGGFTGGEGGNYQFGPNGEGVGDGGGAWFMLDTFEGFSTFGLPAGAGAALPAERIVVRPKTVPQEGNKTSQ